MSSPDPRLEVVAYPLDRDAVVVRGPDAAVYLQGQLSQDLEPMRPGDSAWSFVLAPAGKVDAWCRVTRRDDDWVLDVDAGFGEALSDRLRRFLLRTDATVEAQPWSGIALRGPGSDGLAATTALVADPSWPGIEGVDRLGPGAEVPPGIPTGDRADLEALRIESGVPAMGRELDQSTIPAATGVVERSVSFTKGCYTGQELVARINARGGATPTRLCGVRAASDRPIEPGAALTVEGVDAGRVTSVARSPWRGETVALAYVKRAIEVPARADIGSEGGEAAHLVALPLA